MRHRLRALRSSPASLAILGACLITLIGVTAYTGRRLVHATRSARAAVEQGVNHLASVAAWELARRAANELDRAAQVTTYPIVQIPPSLPLPPANAAFERRHATCMCPAGLPGSSFAMIEAGRKKVVLSGSGWLGADSALLLAAAKLALMSPPRMAGMAGMGPPPFLVLLAAPDGRQRIAVGRVALGADQRARAAYFKLIDGQGLDSALTATLSMAQFLPRSITRGIPRDSLIGIQLLSATGAIAYAKPLLHTTVTAAAIDSLGGTASGLLARVELSERARDLVGPDVAPAASARIAWLLFGLSIGVSLICIWEVRRHIALSQLRSDFVASVSHDLRTPLALITSYTETLLAHRARDADEARQFLEIILRETQRLGRLVANVLRIHGGRRQPHIQLVDCRLGAVIEAACRDYGPCAAAHGCRVDVKCLVDPSIAVDCDAMRQILFNVLDNAVRYGGENQLITVGLDGDAERLIVTVDDQGPGIPPPFHQRVVQRFTRIESALGVGAKSGWGIGLAVVRELAEAHGATIRLEQSPAGGARFRMDIPIERRVAGVGAPAQPARVTP